MTETFSKSRLQAEAAFSKTQTRTAVQSRVLDERDAAEAARAEKTARLREARLAKEAADRLTAATPPTKRARKS